MNAEVNTSVDVSGKNDSRKEENKLPDVDLEKYKDELLSYQELQRKNMMLKLQSENQKLESEIKKVDHYLI
ncbi:periplasmic protein [Escherichia coli]|uniref:Periplasmic protein n=1 Tax=Escherichia coli TaxID=562 RepID=A0A377HG87_ECOLX|nr:periplasmic protein [Escherichia coli]